jgi:hypothetical protein
MLYGSGAVSFQLISFKFGVDECFRKIIKKIVDMHQYTGLARIADEILCMRRLDLFASHLVDID